MESIEYPKNLVYIGAYSFYHCQKLTSFDVPNTVTEIGNSAFSECKSLTTITLNENLTILPEYFLYEAESLTYIEIPKNVKIINEKALGSTSIYSIIIPESVELIDQYAFYSCVNLSSVILSDSINVISDGCFLYCKNLTTIYLPEKIKVLDDYAFGYCFQLINITIPKGLTYIGNCSFIECNMLKSIFIADDISNDNDAIIKLPNNITSIGSRAFEKCTSLTSIILNEALNYLGPYAFSDCTMLEIIDLNNNLEEIYVGTFKNCANLHSLKIGNNIKIIGNYSFYNCTNLKTLEIPDNVVTINNSAFSYCTELEIVKFGKNLQIIGNYAFQYCSNLTNITIPSSVINLGYDNKHNPFEYCEKLESYYVEENNSKYFSFDGILYDKYNNVLDIPINKRGHFIFNDMMTSIFYNLMQYSKKVTSVSFGKNLIYICSNSFANCENLESVIMQDKVELIDYYAFSNCYNLKTVVLSKNLQTINNNSFAFCYNLTIVNYTGTKNFSSSVDAFYNCTELKSINVMEDFEYDSFCGIDVSKNIVFVPEISSSLNEESSYIDDLTSSEIEIIPPTNDPNNTNVPISTPIPEIIDSINISNDINENQLDDMLKDKFNKLGNDKDNIKIVIINHEDDNQKVPFNSDLDENQYIKLDKGVNIDFIGGNLNMILPDNGKTTVILNNDKQNKISIKGDGELEIEFSSDSQSNFINLNSNSQINGSFVITVPDKTESLTIDSIDLTSESSIIAKKENSNEKVKFTVKNLTANYKAVSSINDLTIQDSLKIYQTATLKVENVDLNDATIEYIIFDYKKENGNWNDPFFKGNFNEPPSSFVLKNANNKISPLQDEEYTIVSGIFEIDGCEKWIEKIQLENTGFNSKTCEDNLALDNENKRIVIKANKPKPNPDDENGENNNKSGLNGGQIAGIVIGCIAGVAIIAIIIFIVIKKRMNSGNSASENSIGNGEEL